MLPLPTSGDLGAAQADGHPLAGSPAKAAAGGTAGFCEGPLICALRPHLARLNPTRKFPSTPQQVTGPGTDEAAKAIQVLVMGTQPAKKGRPKFEGSREVSSSTVRASMTLAELREVESPWISAFLLPLFPPRTSPA